MTWLCRFRNVLPSTSLAKILAGALLIMPHFQLSASTPTIVLATDYNPPFSYKDDGTAKGLYVELAQALTNSLPVKLEIVFCPWARCVKMVEQNQAHMLIGLSKSPEREKHFYFLKQPFFQTSNAFHFFYMYPEHEIKTHAQLKQKIIGKIRGSAHTPEFDNDKSLNTVDALDVRSMINLLRKKRIDSFIYLGGAVQTYLDAYDAQNEIKRSPYSIEQKLSGYIVIANEWQGNELKAQLDNRMEMLLESGFIDDLYKRYDIKK